jgi:hypothetical protein
MLFCALALVLAAGCDSSDSDDGNGDACASDVSYDPNVEALDFVEGVDNPYFPLTPGTTYTYGGAEEVVVEVTSDTKEILGIQTTVVRDTVYEDGEVIEDTYDWYAQDADGNVWYMGEDTKEYEDGEVVSTAGSWEAGVDGAQPGYQMLADPAVGDAYYQEYYACEAEDEAEVLSVDEDVSVAFGDYSGCVQTHDFTALEPDVSESKYYCADVGFVLEIDDNTGDRVELEEVTTE